MSENTQTQEQNPLEEILEQINCLGLGLLWTGLTILSKDMMEFLSVGAYDTIAVNRFRQIYIKALNEDRAYWEVYGPDLYKMLCEIDGIPSGFTRAAREGNFNLAELTDEGIIRKWTHYPGWELTKQAGLGLKDAICHPDNDEENTVGVPDGSTTGNGGVSSSGSNPGGINGNGNGNGDDEEEENPLSAQDELTLKLARKILLYGFEDKPFWYPIAMYIAHLLARTGYEHLCQDVLRRENGNINVANQVA